MQKEIKDPIHVIQTFCMIQLEILRERETKLRKEIMECKIQKEFLESVIENLRQSTYGTKE